MIYLYLFLFCFGFSQRTFPDVSVHKHAHSSFETYEEKLDRSQARKMLIRDARKLKGTKYLYGGTTSKGMDCSGFVYSLFSKINISLPRSTSLQVSKGRKVKRKDLAPGDLIFFQRKGKGKGKVSHVAMVVELKNNELVIVHSTSSKGVIFEDLNSSAYWKSKYFVAKRLI